MPVPNQRFWERGRDLRSVWGRRPGLTGLCKFGSSLHGSQHFHLPTQSPSFPSLRSEGGWKLTRWLDTEWKKCLSWDGKRSHAEVEMPVGVMRETETEKPRKRKPCQSRKIAFQGHYLWGGWGGSVKIPEEQAKCVQSAEKSWFILSVSPYF